MSYATLHDRLRGDVAKNLQKKLNIRNIHALPRIEKIVVNVGINRAKMGSKETQDYIVACLRQMTGQQPSLRFARKSVSNFKISEGMTVGAMVTLRGRRMEEFLDRLLCFILPRIRDFRGFSLRFDGRGNYAIGIRDHSIFPEVAPPDAGQIFGLQIQITTTAEKDEAAAALLQEIGFPFRK